MSSMPAIVEKAVAPKTQVQHRLDLSRYPVWNSRKAEIRHWLIDQIADRAIELNEARKAS